MISVGFLCSCLELGARFLMNQSTHTLPIHNRIHIRIRDGMLSGSLYGDLPQIGGHKHCKIISSLSLDALDRRPLRRLRLGPRTKIKTETTAILGNLQQHQQQQQHRSPEKYFTKCLSKALDNQKHRQTFLLILFCKFPTRKA